VKHRPLGKGGAAIRPNQVTSGNPVSSPSALAPQGQACAACGAPGHPPRIGDPQPNDLTIPPFLGRLALICRTCTEVAALDRDARRGRATR
jgi:hypothetical protein